MDAKGNWSASPAFDLTPSAGEGHRGIHAMLPDEGVGKEPTLTEWTKIATGVGIHKDDIHQIYEKCRIAVSQWDKIATDCEITSQRRKEIAAILIT